ncbi:MAG TPA: phosphatase domain-containing protein, partial [Pirellulales bacterium]
MPSSRRQRKLWILDTETADFFPSWAAFDAETATWVMHVHGWVYNHKPSSKIRSAILHWLCRMLGMSTADFASAVFQERSRPFLVSNEKGKRLSVRLGDFVFPLGKSASTGHFEGIIKLSPDEMNVLRTEIDGSPVVPFEAVMPPTDERRIVGGARIIAPTGLSIVSDIDDTIKHSDVASRRKLFANTLVRDFAPIPGMADLYRQWAQQGAEFHYVSTSPWQLYKPLAAFMETYQFPRGTVHLKAMRWKNTGLLRLLLSPKSVKRRAIKPLIAAMPGRKFLFV